MADYINRETLRTTYTKWRNIQAKIDDDYGYGLMDDVLRELNAQPTADVAPVRHGRWVEPKGGFWEMAKCSLCGEWQPTAGIVPQYCPNCGAPWASYGKLKSYIDTHGGQLPPLETEAKEVTRNGRQYRR